jgi:uncharacterized protein (TIGR00255 family)
MKSMTGHGRGECVRDGFKITVELSSVNRKQMEMSINLPRELESLESKVRDALNRKLARGRLTAKITLQSAGDSAAGLVRLNSDLARAYANEFRKLAKELGIVGDLTLDTLLKAHGVLQNNGDSDDADAYWPAVEKALKAALSGLVKMRQQEGDHLAGDLSARIKAIAKSAARIQKRSPKVVLKYRDNLMERIANLGADAPAVDDDKLAREVAYFADRCDVTEEITRLNSHFEQFAGFVKSSKPVGRTLDFLSQEMNREINTIGSKANDSDISREVVKVKAELEKFREQVQNVE